MLEILLPPFILLMLFIAWYSFVRGGEKYGAPFIPLEPEVLEEVMLHAQIKPGNVFYDLGSGDGRIVIAAALRGANAIGIEIDKIRVLYSKLWVSLLRLNDKAKILQQDIFKTDLSNADIVYLFLLQETNNKLQEKLEKELKPGTTVISVAFDFPGWKPILIDPNGPKYGPIYIYKK